MHNYLDKTKLTMVARSEDVTLYKLDTPKLLNKYFITTYEGSRRLLTTPEEVGFQTYLDTMPPTVEALKYFRKKGLQELPQKAAVVQNKVENDEKQDE